LDWSHPPSPTVLTEQRLITAILDGNFPINSVLPSERDLAVRLGVTRPTLREALQRLSRDGWIEIHHGRSTRVRDYWREGNLAILGAIAQHANALPADFVANLLYVRTLMAPAYTRLACLHSQQEVIALLQELSDLTDTPQAFAEGDWKLHYHLTIHSCNPVFTLILNGFQQLYHDMGLLYFASPEARQSSRQFYADLLTAVSLNDLEAAESVTRSVMEQSMLIWKKGSFAGMKDPSSGG
jgi:GntR family negative regulator for fad regulon and positive regulator of fabA